MIPVVGKEHLLLSLCGEDDAVMVVAAGSVLDFETVDCYFDSWKQGEDLSSHVMGSGNPATGPVYILGADEGDTLRVFIIDITLANEGVMLSAQGFGILGDMFHGQIPRRIPIQTGYAFFSNVLRIPVAPMIGVAAVAPAMGSVRTTLPGPHGGNMDNKMVTTGATLYLPVFAKGALFSLGDLHAAMGDGEVGANGIEVSGTVRVRLDIVKGLYLSNPLVENERWLSTIASDKSLDEAVEKSVRDMFDLVLNRTDIPAYELNMLFSIAGETQICQSVSPLRTARFLLPKHLLVDIGFHLC